MSSSPIAAEHFEFNELVFTYTLHQKLMQLHFAQNEPEEPKLRPLDPTDVQELSEVEMAGLMYWVGQQKAYDGLSDEEKGVLLQKYAVRKISLDHFYSAAKHPERCEKREFVMNNYTFVPSDRTGFETVDDDEQQIKAKRELFSRTFNYFWSNIIDPFVELKVTDAEIVFMHVMLLWSASNNSSVTPATAQLMESRRLWAQENLSKIYSIQKLKDSEKRLQKIQDLVHEVEIVADMHCEDFVAAKALEIKNEKELECEKLYYGSGEDSGSVDFSDSENEENVDPLASKKRKIENDTTVLHDSDPSQLVLNSDSNSNLEAILAPLPDDVPFFEDGCIL